MTDTTDIKALRSEAANIIGLLTTEGHQSFTLDKAADFFDDVFRLLEAERQRADDLQRINGIQETTIEVFRHKELAALKAKLANPVVLPSRFKPEMSKVDVFKDSPVMKLDATGGWLNRTGVIIALKDAGFTVKE